MSQYSEAFEYMEGIDATVDGWELKEGAPPEVVRAYREYKRAYDEAHKMQIVEEEEEKHRPE